MNSFELEAKASILLNLGEAAVFLGLAVFLYTRRSGTWTTWGSLGALFIGVPSALSSLSSFEAVFLNSFHLLDLVFRYRLVSLAFSALGAVGAVLIARAFLEVVRRPSAPDTGSVPYGD